MFASFRPLRRCAAALALGLCACAAPPRPLPAPAPPAADTTAAAPAPPLESPTVVWTRAPGVSMRLEGGTFHALPHLMMRLEVLRADSAELHVRCPSCTGVPTGMVPREAVVWRAPSPAEASRMELADFVLAIRQAAAEKDFEALRGGMSARFVHSLQRPEGSLEALGRWRAEGAADLERLPFVLDRGVVAVPGTSVFAGPPEFVTTPGYADLRAGFQRGANGWEWVFFVKAAR